MSRENVQLAIANVLLAILVLNSLDQRPTQLFQTASFVAAYAVLVYVAYTFLKPFFGELRAR